MKQKSLSVNTDIEKEARLMYRFAILTLGDQEAACCLVAESCGAVCRRLKGRESGAELCRQLLADIYRRCLGRKTAYQPRAVLAAFPSASPESRELIFSLAQADLAVRAALALRFASGLSQSQALRIMGRDQKEADQLLKQGMARLVQAQAG